MQIYKKVSFPLLQKHVVSEALLDERDFTPQVVNWDICRKTVMDHKKDLFVDIDHEKKLVVFAWEKRVDGQAKLRAESMR